MKLKADFLQSRLTSSFRILGFSVGRHPLLYTIVPLVVTGLFSIGFCWVHVVKNAEYLYCPTNGRSLRERATIETLFPPSNYNLGIEFTSRLENMVFIMLLPKDNLSVLRESILDDAVQIDNIIHNTKITWKNRTLSFNDICLKSFTGDCAGNDVLNLKGRTERLREKELRIKFPVNIDATTQRVSVYVNGLGGVKLDESSYVVDALALRLIYLLDHGTIEKNEMSQKWEEYLIEIISGLELKNVKIIPASSILIDNEISRILEMSIPLMKIMIPCIGLFTVISCMTSNCITSKPWVAVAACLSPTLGAISTFGVLFMLRVEFVDLNIVILFLLLGIGLDDSFIMLAAWRRTDSKLKVEERLSQAYSEAAVSITITSLTNCLSFFIGIGSFHRFVRLFCLNAAVSVIFAYAYQITFFGGIMAMSGIREHKGLHSLFCVAVKKENVPHSSVLKFVYFGCTNTDKEDCIHEKPHVLLSYMKRLLSLMLTTGGKVVIMTTFLLYLLSSSFCLSFVKEDYDHRMSMTPNSYGHEYVTTHFKYFSEYGDAVQIVINETLDYSSKQVQNEVEQMLHTFTEIPNINGEEFSFSWLKYFLQSVNDKSLYFAYYGYNISDSDDFIAALRDVFLKYYHTRYFQQYIKFNENRTEIISSRFIVLSKNLLSSFDGRQLMSKLWKKADSITYHVYVHNMWFPLHDVLTGVGSSIRTTLLTAIGLITIIFFVLIPNIFCTISILFTAVSIQIGVIGYMSIWDVYINQPSMVSLIISVGLSVDYAAHVSYAYLSSKEDSPDKKTIAALRSTAYPVFQGCISTLLGVGILGFGPVEVMTTFFKVITLVMLISLFHGILVIPFLLNTFEHLWRSIVQKLCKERLENGKSNLSLQ